MPSTPFSTRPALQRTFSWPPTTYIANADNTPSDVRARSGSMSATSDSKPTFEDDLSDHPEDHFLSYWAYDDDDDDDEEEVVWSAGITDFALFDNDRRRAQETHDELPSKWSHVVSQQAAAARRSAQRIRADAAEDPRTGGLFQKAEELPDLTPDSSPQLRDDVEDGEAGGTFRHHHQHASKSMVAKNYLTVIVTPPSDDEDDDYSNLDPHFYDDAKVPSPTVSFEHATKPEETTARKLQRPGLRHARTLSGKAHVWRRPSWDIYPVGEDSVGEEYAERDEEEMA